MRRGGWGWKRGGEARGLEKRRRKGEKREIWEVEGRRESKMRGGEERGLEERRRKGEKREMWEVEGRRESKMRGGGVEKCVIQEFTVPNPPNL